MPEIGMSRVRELRPASPEERAEGRPALLADVSTLLAVVSHDLKNPLCAVYMNAKLIQKAISPQDPMADSLHRYAQVIQQSAERMHYLIRDLLDQARIENGHFSVERRENDLGLLVGEAFDMLQPIAAEKSVQLVIPEVCGRFTVLCDKERIIQVLSNLVGNAVKFAPRGGEVRIEVALEAEDSEIRIGVRDNGPGISEEHMPRIFDRFWQPPETVCRGNGLGLAIAKGIVEAHGGKIWVESRLGAGSTFFLTLTGHRSQAI